MSCHDSFDPNPYLPAIVTVAAVYLNAEVGVSYRSVFCCSLRMGVFVVSPSSSVIVHSEQMSLFARLLLCDDTFRNLERPYAS